MDNISISADTWTKVSDATSLDVALQSENGRASFYVWVGSEPSGGDKGFYCKEFVKNGGSDGEEIWVYAPEALTLVVYGVV